MDDAPGYDPSGGLEITEELTIPWDELRFRFSRASGPGGQNVNRTATRVELLFDIQESPSLNDAQRAQLLDRLRHLVDSRGVLHLYSQSAASQLRNRQQVTTRLATLLRQGLRVQRPRVNTRPTAASRQRRLSHKRVRSATKQLRRRVNSTED